MEWCSEVEGAITYSCAEVGNDAVMKNGAAIKDGAEAGRGAVTWLSSGSRAVLGSDTWKVNSMQAEAGAEHSAASSQNGIWTSSGTTTYPPMTTSNGSGSEDQGCQTSAASQSSAGTQSGVEIQVRGQTDTTWQACL